MKNIFAGEGILPAGLLCYGKQKKTFDDSYWQTFEETLLREVQIGALLGSPSIRMFGGDITNYHSPVEYIDRMAQGIEKALTHYPNMNIVLQNHCNSYSFLQGVQLANCLRHDRFGLVFSPDHCFLMQENITEVFSLAKIFSKQIYISDILLDQPRAPNARNYISGKSVLPGKGDINITDALKAIGGDEFKGWITFKWEKIWHNELEEPEIALPYFLKYIKNLLHEC